MNQRAPHKHLQLDGPHLRPGRWLPSRSLGLLVLLLPALFAALVSFPPYGTNWSWPLALAGSLGGVIIFSPNRRKTLPKMDWAITSVLAGLMIAAPGYRTAEFYLAATAGFLCGFMVSRPEAAYLLGRPGLIAWLALLPTLVSAGTSHPVDSALIYGFFDWPIFCALVTAGFCFATGRTRFPYWLLPWLAALAGHIFHLFLFGWPHGELLTGPPLYRAAALILPAFFIAPQMVRSHLELLIYEVILVIFMFHPFPALGWISDPTLLWSGLIFVPRWYLDRKQHKQTQPTARLSDPASCDADQTIRIKCGHQGTAARLTEWRGLSSCRLAAGQDEGHLLCPYGCLGLGDCLRACPAQAISLDSGFPVIDSQLCHGCGRCRTICPKQLIEISGGEIRAFIPCASRSGLKNNAKYCEQSCLGCGKCRKACPAQAIGRSGDSGAMSVDQAACRAYGHSCGQICRVVCPRKII